MGILSTVRSERRDLGHGFEKHAAPQAISAYLEEAREAQRVLDEHVKWLCALLNVRNEQIALGEWPPGQSNA